MKRAIGLFSIYFVFFSFSQVTRSSLKQDLPLYEIGVGAVNTIIPDYPGSDQVSNRFVPFPAFLYRGKIIRSDEEGGVRSRFYKNESLEVNLSFGGSLPVDSKDNRAREGMADLDLLLESGPNITYKFLHPRVSGGHKLNLTVPLRFAFSSNFKDRFSTRGLTFNPMLYYLYENFGGKNSFLVLTMDSMFGSKKFMDYFYAVSDVESKSTRRRFGAKKGYLGSYLSIGYSQGLSRSFSLFGGYRYGNLKWATNRKSPLFVKTDQHAVALGVVWWFYDSKKQGVK